jgi:hypothetical protein
MICVNRFTGTFKDWCLEYTSEVSAEEFAIVAGNIIGPYSENLERDDYSYYLGDLRWLCSSSSFDAEEIAGTYKSVGDLWERRRATEEEEELFYIGRIAL